MVDRFNGTLNVSQLEAPDHFESASICVEGRTGDCAPHHGKGPRAWSAPTWCAPKIDYLLIQVRHGVDRPASTAAPGSVDSNRLKSNLAF